VHRGEQGFALAEEVFRGWIHGRQALRR
jgi:hypothetical protein